MLYDGDSPDDNEHDADSSIPKRPQGAYYKNIERKMLLKKKRVNVSRDFKLSGLLRIDPLSRCMTNTKINGKSFV